MHRDEFTSASKPSSGSLNGTFRRLDLRFGRSSILPSEARAAAQATRGVAGLNLNSMLRAHRARGSRANSSGKMTDRPSKAGGRRRRCPHPMLVPGMRWALFDVRHDPRHLSLHRYLIFIIQVVPEQLVNIQPVARVLHKKLNRTFSQ